jgi:hypothetical protein
MAEEGEAAFVVQWVALDTFSQETPLYPEGLLEMLMAES